MTIGAVLRLPARGSGLEAYRCGLVTPVEGAGPPPRSRIAFAAAHVVADPLAAGDPPLTTAVDWDATLANRRHLWSLGLGVADAMDTAQRGMGLDWPTTRRLIRESAAEARRSDGRLCCGAGTDQLADDRRWSLDAIVDAYAEQVGVVAEAGAQPVVMASRALAATATGAEDYLTVYGRILGASSQPVILHWLGAMFDPALRGYWGADAADDLDRAADTVVALCHAHAGRIDGVKVSVLDAACETRLRARLPDGVRLYTGDDFNYPDLIAGDGERHSDALLGIFAAIGPVAAAALRALDSGDEARFTELLDPTVPLARVMFGDATRFYKVGVAFLAWLNGHQPAFRMVGGIESARSIVHLAEVFRLADAARLLVDPPLAAHRMRALLTVAGIDQP